MMPTTEEFDPSSGESTMTVDEAFAWCVQNKAVVTFGKHQGMNSISVEIPGHGVVAWRRWFTVAVEAASKRLEAAHAQEKS